MDILKLVGTIADFVTLTVALTGIPWVLIQKRENLIAFKISLFIYHLVKVAVILLILPIVYIFWKWFYESILIMFIVSISPGKEYWDTGKKIAYILSYFISLVVFVAIIWNLIAILWTSSFNTSKQFLNFIIQKPYFSIKPDYQFEILNATYGSDERNIAVEHILKQMIVNNMLTIRPSENLFDDPHPGTKKKLIINYRVNNEKKQITIPEGLSNTIPEINDR